MFTGIVQSQAQVISIIAKESFINLTIGLEHGLITHLEKGASVAINGVCLTAVDFGILTDNQPFISFDVIDETLRVTSLSVINSASWLNIERSLKAGDEIGGHMVSGHIHCQARLINKRETTTNCQLTFHCERQWMKYIMEKGFVALNGVSLTVGKVDEDSFDVHLIPETLRQTNLGKLTIDDFINLELDQQTITIVNTIEKMNLQLPSL